MTEVAAEQVTNVTENSKTTTNGADKNDESNLTKLESDIINQIEYYFGDSNLRRDKFLINKISENPDGYVPIEVLLTFKRLKSLSDDAKVIADAIDKSTEGLVQLNEDRSSIRRHPENVLPEFNEEVRKEVQSRTAYAKGFPLTADIAEVIDFFNAYNKVVNVVMRKYYCNKTKTYLFKGSVFVTFATRDQCLEFVQKPRVEHDGKELIRHMQIDYLELKKQERAAKDKKKSKKNHKEEEPEFILPKGTIIHFDGVKNEATQREDIKAQILSIDSELQIPFVNFKRGDKEGFVRFSKEEDGKKFIEKLKDGKMTVCEDELTIRLVDGDEETEFLKKAVKDMQDKRGKSKVVRKKQNRKRRPNDQDDDDDNDDDGEPAAKQAKE